jgi:hypothetical protein
MPSIKQKIEKDHGRTLTNRQMTFAKFFVEGVYSNAECARKAGYAEDVAAKQASILLNGRDYPHVLEYVTELREERERRYGVTMVGQLERLHKLSHAAEDAGSFSAAINAEKIRSALGGLTVDRREQVNTMDALSRDDIIARLADMQRKYPQAFVVDGTMKDVTNEQRPRSELLEVKSLGSRSLFLFRGSEALPLARGGLSEAQGLRFEGLAPCISALRLASLEHYSEVLRLAPCLAPCASMEEGGE